MALNVTRWAREQTAGDQVAKAALMALAERADAAGYCHPSIATVAADMECGRATAKRAVHRLVDRGLVELVIRYEDTRAGERRQTSNRYRLLVTQGQSDPGSERPGGQSDPTPGSERPTPQGQSDPPGTSQFEPVTEPSSSVGGDRESEPASSSDDDDRASQVRDELVARLMAGRSDIRDSAAYRRKLKRTVLAERAPDLDELLVEHPTWSASQIVDVILGRRSSTGAGAATEDPAVAEARRHDAARAHGANVGANVPDDELDDVLAAYRDPGARAAFLEGRDAARSGAAA